MVVIFLINFFPAKIKNPGYTIGTVYEIDGEGRSKSRNYFYFVNGERFTGDCSYVNGDTKEDMYKVEYDLDKPERSNAILEEPLFLENENVDSTIGDIISTTNFPKSVRFKYIAVGVEHCRFQNYNDKIYLPKKGDSYFVKFSSDNPQRSIIYLDKKNK